MRITALANYGYWQRVSAKKTIAWRKLRWYERITDSAVRFVPDYRHRVVDTDMFTPRTIVRFTGHDNGAIYGAPDKQLDGLHAPGEPVRLRHRPGLRRHHRQHHQRHHDDQPPLPCMNAGFGLRMAEFAFRNAVRRGRLGWR